MHTSEKMNGIATTGMFSWMEEKSMYTARKNHVAQKYGHLACYTSPAQYNNSNHYEFYVTNIYRGCKRCYSEGLWTNFDFIFLFLFFNAPQNCATHAHQCPALIVMGAAAAWIEHTTLYSSSRRGKNQHEQRLFQSFLNMPLTFNAFLDEWAPKKYLQLALWPDRPLMHTLTCSSFYYFLFPVFIWKLNKALSIPKCKHILPIHCSTFSTTEQKRESYCITKQCSYHCVQLSCQLCYCSCSASSPCATIGKQDTKFQLTSMCSFVSTFITSCDAGIFELVYLVRDLRHLWWPGVQQCKIVLSSYYSCKVFCFIIFHLQFICPWYYKYNDHKMSKVVAMEK